MENDSRTEVNKVYTLEQLITYKKHIEELATTENIEDSKEVVFNDSAIHASLIMGCLLSHSTNISMFCGKFSIFREAFGEKIKKMLEDSMYNSIRETDAFINFRPYEDSLVALTNFFNERNGRMTVIVEEDPKLLENESIWSELRSYIKTGKLVFYKRNENTGKLSHFAVGDNKIYRWENNQIERTALCSFNDDETVSLLKESFNQIKAESKEFNFN